MRRRPGGLAAALATGAAIAIACARPAPAPAPGAPATAPGAVELAATLVALGRDALAAGDAARARNRFERALAAAPGDAAARGGLARALLALGREEEARAVADAAIAHDPGAPDARLALAELALRAGDRAAARAHLDALLAAHPAHLEGLEQLLALTGPAPPGPPADLEAAVARALAHPLDPRALTDAGAAALAAGRAADEASGLLERALQVADLDPASAWRAARLLQRHDPAWADRRVVPVHVYADEALRARPTWRFQARLVFAAASLALDPVLGVRFVPLTLAPFEAAGAGFDLGPMRAAFARQHPHPPAPGIVALLVGRTPPRAPGRWRRGEAEYLGRILAVRLAPDEVASRTLAHELMHLYGAVHVNPDVASLMNPEDEGGALDPWNAAIARALRARRFTGRGLDADVLAHADLATAIEAYRDALAANVSLRNSGVLAALSAAGGSPIAAAPELRAATRLDAHHGDVASFLAQLLARRGDRRASAAMWETAARLYGPGSARGRVARERARALDPDRAAGAGG